eukprot:2877946-Rhodomonas_salina.1
MDEWVPVQDSTLRPRSRASGQVSLSVPQPTIKHNDNAFLGQLLLETCVLGGRRRVRAADAMLGADIAACGGAGCDGGPARSGAHLLWVAMPSVVLHCFSCCTVNSLNGKNMRCEI